MQMNNSTGIKFIKNFFDLSKKLFNQLFSRP